MKRVYMQKVDRSILVRLQPCMQQKVGVTWSSFSITTGFNIPICINQFLFDFP